MSLSAEMFSLVMKFYIHDLSGVIYSSKLKKKNIELSVENS